MKKILMAAALSAAVVAAPLHAQVNILFNSYEPPTGGHYKVVKAWMSEVEKVTEGRVKFQVPPGSLARPEGQWELVTSGVADGAFFLTVHKDDALRLPQLAALPMQGSTAEATAVALWRTHVKFFQQANEYQDVVLLGYIAAPPSNLFSQHKEPVRTVADLKNKTVLAVRSTAKLLGSLGAQPIVGSATTAYEQLSSGVVELAASMSYAVMESFNLSRYLKSATEFPGGLFTGTFAVILNKTKWEEIPKRDKDLMLSVSGENFGRLSGIYWDKPEAEAKARWIKAKRAIAEPSAELLAQVAAVPFEKAWIEQAASRGVDGKTALEYYRQQMQAVLAAPRK